MYLPTAPRGRGPGRLLSLTVAAPTSRRSVWALVAIAALLLAACSPGPLLLSPSTTVLQAKAAPPAVQRAASVPGARFAISGHVETVRCLSFSPDGRYLASGGDDGLIVWDLQTAVPVVRSMARAIIDCAFVAARRPEVLYTQPGGSFALDVESGRERRLNGDWSGFAVAASKHKIVGVSDDASGLVERDVTQGRLRRIELPSESTDCYRPEISYAGDDQIVVLLHGFSDGDFSFWRWDGRAWSRVYETNETVYSVQGLPGGEILFTTFGALWRLVPGGKPQRVGRGGPFFWSSYDGTVGAAPDDGDDPVYMARPDGRHEECERLLPGSSGSAIELAPDGRTFALGAVDGSVQIVRLEDCELVQTLGDDRVSISAIAAGDRLLIADSQARITEWSPRDLTPIRLTELMPGDRFEIVGLGSVAAADLTALPSGGWLSLLADATYDYMTDLVLATAGNARVHEVEGLGPDIAMPAGEGLILVRDGVIHKLAPGAVRTTPLFTYDRDPYTIAYAGQLDVAPATGELTIVGGDGALATYSLDTGSPIRQVGARSHFGAVVAYTRDERHLLVLDDPHAYMAASPVPVLELYSLASPARPLSTVELGGTEHGSRMHLVTMGSRAWVGVDDGRVLGFDVSEGRLRKAFETREPGTVVDLAPLQGQDSVAIALPDRVTIRSAVDGKLRGELVQMQDGSWATIDADGNVVASQGSATRVVIEEPESRKVAAVDTLKTVTLSEPRRTRSVGGATLVRASIRAPDGAPLVTLDGLPVASVRASASQTATYELEIALTDPLGGEHRLSATFADGSVQTRKFEAFIDVRAEPVRAGRTRALAIANSDYPGARKNDPQPIPSARRDAEAFVDALSSEQSWGMQDLAVTANLGFDAMRDAIRGFLQGAKPSDVVVLYYAGHGDTDAGGGFLIPVDYTAAQPDRRISARQLWNWITQSPAKQIVVILDACYAGAFSLPRNIDSAAQHQQRVLFVVSASAGSVVQGSDTFSAAFTRAMKDPSKVDRRVGAVTVQSAFLAAQAAVMHQHAALLGARALDDLPLAWPRAQPAQPGSTTSFAAAGADLQGAEIVALSLDPQTRNVSHRQSLRGRKLELRVRPGEPADVFVVRFYYPADAPSPQAEVKFEHVFLVGPMATGQPYPLDVLIPDDLERPGPYRVEVSACRSTQPDAKVSVKNVECGAPSRKPLDI